MLPSERYNSNKNYNNPYNSAYLYDTINPKWNKYIKRDLMSIGLSIPGKDCIVVATDSLRASNAKNCILYDDAQKLWVWNNKVVIMVVGGNTRYSDWLVDQFSKRILPILTNYDDIVNEFSEYAIKDYRKHTPSIWDDDYGDDANQRNPFESLDFAIAGYDIAGEAKTTYMTSNSKKGLFYPLLTKNEAFDLAENDLPYYWTNKFNYLTWDTRSLIRLAIFIINEQSKQRDNRVGGDIQLAVINKDKAEMVDKQIVGNIRSEVNNCLDSYIMEQIVKGV
jgi:20S proteasome alpha/beta subunit